MSIGTAIEAAAERLERWRVRRHHRLVHQHLRRAPVELPVSIAARRAAALDRYRTYGESGPFPSNDRRGLAHPVFRSEDGARCAVADLLVDAGEVDLVDEVVATQNRARVRQIADARIDAWAQRHGLSRRDLELIQVPYVQTVSVAHATPAWLGVAAIDMVAFLACTLLATGRTRATLLARATPLQRLRLALALTVVATVAAALLSGASPFFTEAVASDLSPGSSCVGDVLSPCPIEGAPGAVLAVVQLVAALAAIGVLWELVAACVALVAEALAAARPSTRPDPGGLALAGAPSGAHPSATEPSGPHR